MNYPRSHWSDYVPDVNELNAIFVELRNFGGVFELKDYVPKRRGQPRWRSYLVPKNNPPPDVNGAGPVPFLEALGEDLP